MAGRADSAAAAVAVVIPAWNAAATIGVQLAALAEQDYAGSWRVVVVDDGSADETGAVVESYIPEFPVELTLVRHPVCRGAAAARNTGAAATSEPLILFCDADDEVAAGWISAFAASLAVADGAGGRIELYRLNPPHLLEWAGEKQAVQTWVHLHEWGMPSPITACCAVTRSAWSELGGFNEILGSLGEDVDFYWRLQCRGMTLVEAPDAIVHYRLRSSPRAILRRLFTAGATYTLLVRAYHHPKRRRQLMIEVAGAVRRSYGVVRKATRRRAIYDLVWVAGRATGLFRGPDIRQIGPRAVTTGADGAH